MANTGTTKLKKIVSRALEIREKAGFTTETISRKRYNMPYIPDAVKQAAKELKTGETKPAKRTKRSAKTQALKRKKNKNITEKTNRKRIISKSTIIRNNKVRKAVNSKGGAKVVDKSIKVSAKQAIEDIKHLYRDLTPMEANMLYSNFKDTEIVDFDFEGLKANIFEKLFDKSYIDYDVHKSTYNLTDFGRKFIKAVKARIETLKGLKYGYNLF